MNTPILADNNLELIGEFRQKAEILCLMLQKEGLSTKPYPSERLMYFNQLQLEQKREVLQQLSTYLDVCIQTVNDGISLKNTSALTWRMVRKMGLVPLGDIFDKIEEDDVVEIYTPKSVQIFRNMKFFEVCSYTLEELLCLQWWQLYNRPNEITQAIFQETVTVFNQESPETMKSYVPVHFLEEIASTQNFRMQYELRYISPLLDGKKISSLLAVERCKLEINN